MEKLQGEIKKRTYDFCRSFVVRSERSCSKVAFKRPVNASGMSSRLVWRHPGGLERREPRTFDASGQRVQGHQLYRGWSFCCRISIIRLFSFF